MQYLLQPKRSGAVAQPIETVERWECDMREYQRRYGKALDEDVKIGVIHRPPSAPNHCHRSSHILKTTRRSGRCSSTSVGHRRTLRVQENVTMDLSMLGKGNNGKGDKKGKGNTGVGKGGDGKDDKKGQERQRRRQRQSD